MFSSTRRRSSFLSNSLVCSAPPHLCAVNPGLWRQTVCFSWLHRAENGNIKVFVLALVLHRVSQSIHLDCMHRRPKEVLHLVKLAAYFVHTYFFFLNRCLSGTQCGRETGGPSQLSWGEGGVRLRKITSLPQG